MTIPKIFTYHCLCSHLILATTRSLDSLPRRRPPGSDSAYIVPLPPPPKDSDSEQSSDESDDDEPRKSEKPKTEKKAETEAEIKPTAEAAKEGDGGEKDVEKMEIDNRPTAQSEGNPEEQDEDVDDEKDYTLLLSSVRDRRPCIIRREDGFERRLLWRCGRCRLIFGYQIDDEDENVEDQDKGVGGGEEEDDEKRKKKKKKQKKGYVYVLPGSVTTAEDMGKMEAKDLQKIWE